MEPGNASPESIDLPLGLVSRTLERSPAVRQVASELNTRGDIDSDDRLVSGGGEVVRRCDFAIAEALLAVVPIPEPRRKRRPTAPPRIATSSVST